MSGKMKNWGDAQGMTVGAVGATQVETMLPVRTRPSESAPKSKVPSTPHSPRVPRITRLMALAIKFQDMIERGEVRDYADLARLGYVTRARLTQIMNLLLLAPRIQAEILGREDTAAQPIELSERTVRPIAGTLLWSHQLQLWQQIKSGNGSCKETRG